MIHVLELSIIIFFGVLGGIALFFFGWGSLLIVGAILSLARDNKHGNPTPLDQDYTLDWEREWEEEKEESKWRG